MLLAEARSDDFAFGKSDVMCSFSRAKRTSLGEAKHHARQRTSRSARAEHIVQKRVIVW